ncbi:type 1 fimbrial protein [Ewingella americana]|jgi:type 1 fimbria pilin|uniref:type 1 fimbrial protein n=1 Tax=Ewingella americana TaxID=41202 RepID=UPI00112E41E5|nr:type 1 fimbrial protein [Ewingella americana]
MNRLAMLLFFGFCTSGMTQAAVNPSSGTIHFYGAIVEDACSLNTTQNNVTTRCFRDGKDIIQTRTLATGNLPNFSLPKSLGRVTTQYINNNPHLAVMTVAYN